MSDYIKREDALGCVLGAFDRQRIKSFPPQTDRNGGQKQ